MTYATKTLALFRHLFFHQDAHHAEQFRTADGQVRYSPACAARFSPACKARAYRCDSCDARALTPLTEERLEQHLAGQITLGVYQLRTNGHGQEATAGWLCLDVDADEETEQAREHVRLMTRLLVARLRNMGLSPVCEYTGNRGYHVWLFVAGGAPAPLLRRLGDWLVDSIVEEEGAFAGIHVEVFPKQTSLRPGKFGNLVKLPLGIHKKTGRRSALVKDDLTPVGAPMDEQLRYLASVRPIPAADLAQTIAEWLPDAPEDGNAHRETSPRTKAEARLSWKTRQFIEHGADSGTRNERLFTAACDLAGNGYNEREAGEMLLSAAVESGLARREVERTIQSAYSKERSPALPDHGDAGALTTDIRNGRRFVEQHAHEARYCAPLGGWLVWDGTRWAYDDQGATLRMAKATVLAMYDEASSILDEDKRIKFVRGVVNCESMIRLRAMLESASVEREVCMHHAAFDADPWLLNVANGTLDLRTGELREHRWTDLITKLAPVSYDPQAEDVVLRRYLASCTDGNPGLAHYLQKAAGYTLTGLCDEETIFLLLGPGATGKSTLVEAMLALLGDYAVKTSFDTFLMQRNVGGARPDLVAMRGARMVAAVEPEKGRRLAASTLKEISGGDTLTVRDLYKSPISYRPTFKVWLAANAAPEMDDDDTGLWRRLHRLPFEHIVAEDERDPEVKRHLISDGRAAVLAWAVQGCLLWQQERLHPPAIVRQKTAELRREFDPLAEFIAERCIVETGVECEARALRAAYEEWARTFGAQVISDKEWGRRLKGLGCQRTRRRSMGGAPKVWWTGIGLVADAGEEPEGAGLGSGPLPF